MFTLAVHAAPPHNAAMNIRFFLGGLRPPNPSRGQGHGETGFPHAPAPAAYFHVSRPCGSAAHQRDENNFLGGHSPPKPSQGPGPGCAGLRPASAEGWGNPVSPHPCARAWPSQTLPRAGVWGNPVPPCSQEPDGLKRRARQYITRFEPWYDDGHGSLTPPRRRGRH